MREWPPRTPPIPGGVGPLGGSLAGAAPDWLQERLFEQRTVFVQGELDDAAANRAAAELMLLDGLRAAPIDLYLTVAASSLEAALTLIDTLDLLRSEVHAHALGSIVGPAVGVLAVADRREAAAHASFQLTLPRVQLDGAPSTVAAASEQQVALLHRFRARLAEATEQPAERIADDFRRGVHLDAPEGRTYGLLDGIATPRR